MTEGMIYIWIRQRTVTLCCVKGFNIFDKCGDFSTDSAGGNTFVECPPGLEGRFVYVIAPGVSQQLPLKSVNVITSEDHVGERHDDTPAGFVVAVTEDLEIPLDAKDFEDDKYKTCGAHEGGMAAGEAVSISCPGHPLATDVFVYLPREDVLRLLLVEVFVVVPGKKEKDHYIKIKP